MKTLYKIEAYTPGTLVFAVTYFSGQWQIRYSKVTKFTVECSENGKALQQVKYNIHGLNESVNETRVFVDGEKAHEYLEECLKKESKQQTLYR
jgi:hypothetical protein